MSNTSRSNEAKGFSRRAFLEAVGAAGALGMVGGSSLLSFGAAAAEGKSGDILTGSHWGAFRAKVKDGRIAGYTPWEKDPQPTHMLKGLIDSVYSPTRIKYPMVRRAYLEKGPGAAPETRGTGDFVRVSWDQALDLVAKELQRVSPQETYGGSAGWMSTGKLHNCRSQLSRLLNMRGGFIGASGDYSTGAGQVIMPHVTGSLEVYEQQTTWPIVVDNTETLVFWGADPVVTNQVGWLVADHGAYPGMKAYKEKGKKVICIDPIKTETCTYFNAEWIAPKPQTDLAMMLGIAHTLVTEKLHDEKFLAGYTTGFDKFKAYLMGETDKTPKTAEWAAEICGVPANVLKQLAQRFAKSRTMLAGGWSIQRQYQGEQRYWMLVTLAAMLGQIGLPGGGFGFSYHYSGGGAPSTDSPMVSGITDGGKSAGPGVLGTIPCSHISDMLLNPGKEYEHGGKKAKYPSIKLVYWVGGNPFTHHQDRNKMIKAFQKVETFVVQDFQWTPTARHADIVLPATTTLERNDIEHIGDYSALAILAQKKVIEPMFEAKHDFDILAGVAKRLGKEKEFTEGKAEMDWLKSFYEGALTQAKNKKIAMPSFDDFWKTGIIEFPVTAAGKGFIRHAKFREDPMLNPLGTPSGRIEIYSKNIEKMNYDDCPPHPMWMEPIERAGGPKTKFPLHVLTKHSKNRLHSQLCGTVLRKDYAVAGREPCLINTADAKARGIKNGDVIRVFNDRGQILAGAKVTDAIRAGSICINEGGWYDPESNKPGALCRYGDVNVLTIDVGTSRLAQANCANSAAVEVEKYKGQAPQTQVFDAPKNG